MANIDIRRCSSARPQRGQAGRFSVSIRREKKLKTV
jgi:hypothetical protein